MKNEEGTTQEFLQSMLLRRVALMPLIKVLRSPEKHIQDISADDAAACAKFENFKIGLHNLSKRCQDFAFTYSLVRVT